MSISKEINRAQYEYMNMCHPPPPHPLPPTPPQLSIFRRPCLSVHVDGHDQLTPPVATSQPIAKQS